MFTRTNGQKNMFLGLSLKDYALRSNPDLTHSSIKRRRDSEFPRIFCIKSMLVICFDVLIIFSINKGNDFHHFCKKCKYWFYNLR